MNADTMEMMWIGVYMAIKFLGFTFMWCLVAGIINKSVGG